MDRLTELRNVGSSSSSSSSSSLSAATTTRGGGRGDVATSAGTSAHAAAAPAGAGGTSAATGDVESGGGRERSGGGDGGDDGGRGNLFDDMEDGLASLQRRIMRPFRGGGGEREGDDAQQAGRRRDADDGGGGGDVDDEEDGEHGDAPTLSAFYEQVDVVKAQLANFISETQSIRAAHRAVLEDPTRSRAPPDTQRARALAVQIKHQLDAIKQDERRLAAAKGEQAAEVRIFAGTHGALARRFMSALKEFQEVQRDCDRDIREQAERELRIIDPSITAEQVDRVLEESEARSGGGGAAEIMRQQMLHATDRDYEQVRVVARDMEERAAALRELEASIQELRSIFMDMSVLVESQGETIDQIEKNVVAARRSTKGGVRQLRTARRRQRGYFRLIFCGFYCLIILLVVVLVPVLVNSLRK